MRVVFGKNLDGVVWPGELHGRDSNLGGITVGEAGFLRLLETATGLGGPDIPKLNRVIAFMNALKKCDSEQRFFHRSLSIDPLSVAKHLLSLRDELRLAGWDGGKIENLARINDLAAVEKELASHDGIADRIAALLPALSKATELPFAKIETTEVVAAFPSAWRRVLGVLKEKGIAIQDHKSCDVTEKMQIPAQSADERFRFIVASDPWLAARWTAAWVAGFSEKEIKNTVLVAPERYRHILSAAFRERGVPFGGSLSLASVARPSAQVLILSLALAWSPKDPEAVAEMLKLQGSPIPSVLASRLAQAIGEAPAVGSEDWDRAVANALETAGNLDNGKDLQDKIKTRHEFYFKNSPVKSGDKISSAALRGICTEVAKWARGYGKAKGLLSYMDVARLADTLADTVDAIGLRELTSDELSRLLSEVLADGVSPDAEAALAGGPIIVNDSAAILDQADNVIWWDFSAGSESRPSSLFWSQDEQAALKDAGVPLPTTAEIALLQYRQWLRPITNVRKWFMAISFDSSASGEPEMPHPIWDYILRKQALRQPQAFMKECGVKNEQLKPVPWAQTQEEALKRNPWNAPEIKKTKREHESPSSIQRLLGCPFAYYIQNEANIRTTQSAALPDGALLAGKLAHELFKRIFQKGAVIEPRTARDHTLKILNALLPQYAANLLMPKNRAQLTYLQSVIPPAAEKYARFIEANSLEILATEEPCSAEWEKKTPLKGRLDQILGKHGKPTLIIDHKWGRAADRRKELGDGAALQLALYAFMVGDKKPVKNIGYFIIESCDVLVLGQDYKEAKNIDGSSVDEILKRAGADFKNTMTDLTAGKLQARGLDDQYQKNTLWKAGCVYCDYSAICGKLWLTDRKSARRRS